MTDPFYKDPNFIKEQKKWYQKLKNSGFVDIESFSTACEPHDILKFPFNSGGMDIEQEEEYYRECRSFLHEFNFKSKTERKIWELHSEGTPYKKIARQARTSYHKVFFAINEIKGYMLRDLNGFDEITRRLRESRTTRQIRGFAENKKTRRKAHLAAFVGEEGS